MPILIRPSARRRRFRDKMPPVLSRAAAYGATPARRCWRERGAFRRHFSACGALVDSSLQMQAATFRCARRR